MNPQDFEKTFWNYYLELEKDYLEIEKLIPFDETNYNTFSYKYMDLLWAICSEIEVLFKEYMKIKEYTPDLDDNGDPIYNINQYKKFVEEKIENFLDQKIICYNPKFFNKTICPFKPWKNNDNLKWWRVYNKLKHDREKELHGKKAYKCANQICVLNALSGLFQLNLYIYGELKDESDKLKVPLYESLLFKLDCEEDPYRYIINGRYASLYTEDAIEEFVRLLQEDINKSINEDDN